MVDSSHNYFILNIGVFFGFFALCVVLYHLLRLVSIRYLLDYSNYEFKSIDGLCFMPYAKLPKDRDFFKKTLMNPNRLFFKTTLPKIDINDYDFTNVDISNCKFAKGTIPPRDIDFFQKIKDKKLVDCTLPSGDYSKHNFNGVYMHRVTFPKDSIMPENPSFFKELDNNCCAYIVLPKSFSKVCHFYDLNDFYLFTPKKIEVDNCQKYIIKKKNNGVLYDFIR